jgi:hypothetical protein
VSAGPQPPFELVHTPHGRYPADARRWKKAFTDSGCRCDKIHSVTVPPDGFPFELNPRRNGIHYLS